MIQIVNFNSTMQNEVFCFVLNNMRQELEMISEEIFSKITGDLDNISDNYIKSGGEFLIAYDYNEKKIRGTIALKIENGVAVLKRFYVSKEVRKQKIGLSLYKALEDIIRKRKINPVYLVSGKELREAHLFYEKNGWNIIGNHPGIFVREGAYLFQKDMEVDNMKEEKYKILKDLIGFNTIQDKDNQQIIHYIESYLKELGFQTEYKTKALIMSIGDNPKLGFLGHTDTVEYTKDFKNPFELIEKDGFLYGLGVCDMKGGISAMLEAVSQIDFHQLKYGLKLYFTYDEEITFSGIYELLSQKKVYPRLYGFWRAY